VANIKPPRDYPISLGAYFFDDQDAISVEILTKAVCFRERRLKMVTIAIVSYPPEGVKEMAKRLMAQPPLPAYMTMKGPYVSGEVGLGIKIITIYEYDQSKISEATEVLAARYAKYFGVPGFTYSLNIWLETKEALKAIGMG